MPDIIFSIKAINAKLTETEISICCLSLLGFEKEEIMLFLNMSSLVYNSRKADIKKKLGISELKEIDFLLKKSTEKIY